MSRIVEYLDYTFPGLKVLVLEINSHVILEVLIIIFKQCAIRDNIEK